MVESDRDIIACNAAFYEAFSARDHDGMAQLWSATASVSCIHPGWDMIVGRDAVMKSWRDLMDNPQSPAVECRHAHGFVEGDFIEGGLSYVLCHEVLSEGILIATNIFRFEDSTWRMVHHQAGPAAMAVPGPDTPAGGTVH